MLLLSISLLSSVLSLEQVCGDTQKSSYTEVKHELTQKCRFSISASTLRFPEMREEYEENISI